MNETSQNLRNTIETLLQTAQFDAVVDTCKAALADARDHSDKVTEVIAIIGLAQGHKYIGKFKESRILIDGALNFANQLRDKELMVLALTASADIFLMAAFQVHEAERDYRQALKIAREIDDAYSIATILTGLASVFLQSDDNLHAQKFARKAFDIAREDGNRYVMCLSLSLIGAAVTNNQPEKAMQAFEDAMTIAQQDNLRLMELSLTSSIGQLLCREGRYRSEGQLMLEKALAMAKDFRSVPHEFTATYQLGRALEQNNALDRAAQYYSTMLERAQEWRARSYEGVAFFNLGILAYNRLHYDDAIANFEQSLSIARETNNPFREAQTEQVLGSSYFNTGDFNQALDHYMAARSLYDSLDNRSMSNIILQRMMMAYFQRFFANIMRWLGFRKDNDSDTESVD